MMDDKTMDLLQERVIKLEARTDRHGDALMQLEAAGRASEQKISDLADAIKTMVTTGKTAIWVVGLAIVASQSGIMTAIKAAIELDALFKIGVSSA